MLASTSRSAISPAGKTPAKVVCDGIVWLSPFPWHGCWQTPHYLAAAWQASGRVGGLAITPAPGWQAADLWRRALAWRVRAGPPGDRVAHRALRSWPALGSARLRRLNLDWAARQVTAGAAARGLRQPLLWVFYANGCAALVRRLGWPYVYHCLDHFEFGDAAEQAGLASGATAIFAASRRLQEQFTRAGLPSCHLPNGVAKDWFRPVAPVCPGPAAASGGRKRRVGYAGALNRHMDYGLLLAVARAFPACELVLLGPIIGAGFSPEQSAALAVLCRLSNVRRIGFRPTWELAAYMRQWDAALLPSRADTWSQAACPLKLGQYLALGLPVVARATESMEPAADLCYLADSSSQFISQLRSALGEAAADGAAPGRHGRLVAARIAYAGQHAWPRILDRALAYLRDSAAFA